MRAGRFITLLNNMMLFIAADHAGFALKEKLKRTLLKQKHIVHDLTPTFLDGDDYPEHGFAVAEAVRHHPEARGILICKSGVGITIAANRRDGVRALVAHTPAEAQLAREEDDANIIAFSGKWTKEAAALRILKTFFETPFSRAQRHRRRVKQLG